MSLIFIFIDGVGLAPAGHDNPLTDADTPALRALLGGPLTIEQVRPPRIEDGGWKIEDRSYPPSSILHPQILLKAIDATLGVAGLPQSGTGQTALLAGVNAAALHGRHQPHFPPVALRGVLAERSIFRRAVDRGGRATFANAFGPGYWQAVAARRIRKSASVIAAEGAGLRFRDGDDLRAGQAVSWDVTNAAMRLREPGVDTPLVAPAQAGEHLARLAHDHDLVFYESFLPDLAGHGRFQADERSNVETLKRSNVRTHIHAALNLLDGLIGGVLTELRASDTLLITSDHGNVESIAAPTHTRNSVPLLVVGAAARAFASVENIAEIADLIEMVAR
jgi:2,3-bisphosphoglycerate-independent phosphoglycerate mutase